VDYRRACRISVHAGAKVIRPAPVRLVCELQRIRREIATTTRQGKGGGKNKVTTYAYEVDLLILLTDNEIDGISRVWRDGKLIWNKSASATNADITQSDAVTDWTRITAYAGAASQLPDPTYEAAVGAANAPAYRGRGAVFIEALQLGQSGALPNLTFEIGAAGYVGDHPAGDGLTLFQTTFAGGSTADVSSFAIGTATITQPVAGRVEATSGNLRIKYQSGDAVSALWTNASFLITSGVEWTLEVMFVATGYEPKFTIARPLGQQDIGSVASGGYAPTFILEGLDGGTNKFYTRQAADFVYGSDVLTTNPSPLQHIAFVKRTGAGAGFLIDVYHNGQRIALDRYWTASGATATIKLGGFGSGADRGWFVDYKGVRVRQAQVYADVASFTPPASPADWGAP
jgi:hypothetical protein